MAAKRGGMAAVLDRAALAAGRMADEWWRANALGVGFCLLCALAAHGSLLAAPVLSVDQELFPLADQAEWFLGSGRWTLLVFKSLTAPVGLAPYQCTLLGLVFLAVAAWTLAAALFPGEGAPGARRACAALFVSSPLMAYSLSFTYAGAGVQFGLWTTSLACALAARPGLGPDRFRRGAACAALVAVGVGAYQSLVLVFAVFVALRCLVLTENPHPTGRQRLNGPTAGFALAVILCALALHQGVAFLAQRAWGLPPVSAYQAGMMGWKSAGNQVDLVLQALGEVFDTKIMAVGAFVRWFPWLALALAGTIAARPGPGRGRAMAALAGVCLLPFGLHLAMGSPLPARSLFALSLAGAGLLGAACLLGRPFVRAALFAAAALFTVNNAYTVDKLLEGQRAVVREDTALAQALAGRIDEIVPPGERAGPVPVAFRGRVERPADAFVLRSETFGQSFFEWEGGNSHRMVAFLRYLGHTRLGYPTLSQVVRAKTQAAGLPVWPAPGSVARLPDGVVVVNLGGG